MANSIAVTYAAGLDSKLFPKRTHILFSQVLPPAHRSRGDENRGV